MELRVMQDQKKKTWAKKHNNEKRNNKINVKRYQQ
jgi:hypothetical protein